jgi:hypothetical protein
MILAADSPQELLDATVDRLGQVGDQVPRVAQGQALGCPGDQLSPQRRFERGQTTAGGRLLDFQEARRSAHGIATLGLVRTGRCRARATRF